jgi:hypothetical protein
LDANRYKETVSHRSGTWAADRLEHAMGEVQVSYHYGFSGDMGRERRRLTLREPVVRPYRRQALQASLLDARGLTTM